MAELSDTLKEWTEQSMKSGHWSANATSLTRGWIKEGLKSRCLTRDLLWGVPVPIKGWEHKVMYVWVST